MLTSSRARARLLALLACLTLARCGCDGDLGFDPLRAKLSASPEEVAFAAAYVGARHALVVTWTNSGDTGAPVLSVDVEGEAYSLSSLTAASLEPGRDVEITVFFAPPTAGTFPGTLTLRADADEGGELLVPLVGEGLEPPACDDPGPCRDVAFDANAGGCVETIVEGPCDDDNACTTAGMCFAGECLGAGVTCEEPPVACYVGLCDREEGCTALPVHESCDDDDPCTQDLCTPTGCTNGPAPDGTSCGELSCATASLCFAGACEQFATPEGVPCSDGDLCTTGDVCSGGECVGDAVTGEPTVVGRAHVFGAARAVGVLLADGRVVMRDLGETNRSQVFTVLGRDSAGLSLETQSAFDAVGDERFSFSNSIAPLSTSGFALLHEDEELEVFSVDAEGVSRRGSFDLGDAQPGEVYYRSPLVAVSATEVASCQDDPDAVTITRAWPVENAAVVHTRPLSSPCRGLAWDEKGARLFILLESGEVLTYGPGGNPLPAFSGSAAIATNGELIASAVPGDDFLGLARDVALLDPITFDEVGRVSPPVGGGALGYVADVALTDRWLFAVSANVLSVFDVTDPASPEPLFAESENAPTNRAPFVMATDDTTLLRNASGGFWDVLHVFDVTGEGPVELGHPSRGGMRRLELAGGRPYTLHTDATHVLDLTSPTAPIITHGGWHSNRWDTLVSLGLLDEGPHFGVGSNRNPMVNGNTPISWRNDASPGASIDLGSVTQPFEPGVVRLDGDGRYAFAARMSNDDEAFFDVYDLALLEANVDDAPGATLATLPLSLPGADRNAYTEVSHGDDRVVLVTQHRWSFDTPPEDLASEVVLVDVSAPAAPLVIARASLTGLVRQGRQAGDVVLAVRRTTGGWYNTDYEGEELLRLVLDDGALRLDASLPLPRSSEILWMDAARAFVRTEDGLAFVTHDEATLSLEASLVLPFPVTDVEVTDDAVWAVGEHGVMSVRPPCP